MVLGACWSPLTSSSGVDFESPSGEEAEPVVCDGNAGNEATNGTSGDTASVVGEEAVEDVWELVDAAVELVKGGAEKMSTKSANELWLKAGWVTAGWVTAGWGAGWIGGLVPNEYGRGSAARPLVVFLLGFDGGARVGSYGFKRQTSYESCSISTVRKLIHGRPGESEDALFNVA